MGRILYYLMQRFVILFGRKVDLKDAPWLDGPIGFGHKTGADFHERLARVQGFQLLPQDPSIGLMDKLEQMNGPFFDAAKADPAIHHFYTDTSDYDFGIEARWNPWMKPFVAAVMGTVSRRVEQLNFPLRAADVKGGMSSELIPVLDAQGTKMYTCWLRRLPASGRVIYAGFYAPMEVPAYEGGIVRTVFPLPGGNVTVILYPEVMPDGSFRFLSKGKKFGGPGYYRVHQLKNGKLKVLMVPIREKLHLHPVGGDAIDADHAFSFWNIPLLTLKFRIRRKQGAARVPVEGVD